MKIIFEESSTATQLYPIEQHARVNYRGRQYKIVGESDGQELSGANKFVRALGIMALVVSGIFAFGIPFTFNGFYEKIDFWAHEVRWGKEKNQHCVPAELVVLTPSMALEVHRRVLNENAALVQRSDRLRLEIGDIFRQCQQTEQKLECIGAEYAEAQQVVQQRNVAKRDVLKLSTARNLLQVEIQGLEGMQDRLLPRRQKMIALHKKLADVRSDGSQSDFQPQCVLLKEKNKQLQGDLRKMKSTEIGYRCRKCQHWGTVYPTRSKPEGISSREKETDSTLRQA